MGSSKKVNIRKQKEIPLIKIKAFDTVFQTTEDVSKRSKRKKQDACLERKPVNENLESALETTGKHVEVSERKKKRKSERSNTLESNVLDPNLVEESLRKSKGNSFSNSLQNTETIMKITNKLNPEFGVNENHGVTLHTADVTVEGDALGKRITSKKKRPTEFENTDRDEIFLVDKKHLDKELSFPELSDLNSPRNKWNNEILHTDLVAVEPSCSSRTDTKNDLTTEIDLVSVEKSSLVTYPRKKKLSHYKGKQLLLRKEEDPSSSLQDKKSSSKEEVSVNHSNDMLTLIDSKGGIKSENEGNVDVAEKVIRVISSCAEKNLEKLPSNIKIGKVKETKPVSCLVIQNDSMESVHVDNSDKEFVPKKRKVKKVKKLMQSISGDEISKDRSRSDAFDQHLVDENVSELSKVHVILEEQYAFDEDNSKVKVSHISGVEIPDVSLREHEKDEMVTVSSKSDVKDGLIIEGDSPLGILTDGGCCSFLPAIEDVPLDKSSANNLSPVTSKRKRKRDKKRKMLLEEGNSALLPDQENPHPKQPEDFEAHYASGEDNAKVNIEIPKVALGDHKNEEMIPLLSSKSDITGLLIDKGDEPLTKEGCSSLLPAVEDVSLGKNSANNLVPASNRRRRKKKRKDVNDSANEDKASENTSLSNPPAEPLDPVLGEENLVMEESPPSREKNLEVEAVHVSGHENLDISRNTCQTEEKTLLNGDVINEAVIVGVVNKEGDHLNMSPALPERAPISCTRKKLLVLDLNGILVDIVSDVPTGYKAHMMISRKALFKRPFCDDFLKFCFENFNVGVWSSRTKRNVNCVVDSVMGDMKNNLLFCWDQFHCTDTGVNTLENRLKPLVLKELKKLWNKHEHSLPWEKGTYDESNTLLLDDSPYKALCNPPHTAIFPRSYTFMDTEDRSLGPGGDLRVYLEGLIAAENVQEYVKQHPFGQRAITNKNPSWGFYVRIIDGNNVPTVNRS